MDKKKACTYQAMKTLFLCLFLIIPSACGSFEQKDPASTVPLDRSRYSYIVTSHPRIFINNQNKAGFQHKVNYWLSDGFELLTKRTNHKRIPGRMRNINDYIYKYGYLYQMTGEKKWAEYAITAMKSMPKWIEAYSGRNGGYGFALEALSIGYDWCYDALTPDEKKYFIDLIDKYYEGNIKNLHGLPDFHNYAAVTEFAILAAGLATYGENPKAPEYLDKARRVVEEGEVRNGIRYNLWDAIVATDGACNWEGATYARHQIFSCLKYAEAWRTATEEKVNLWKGKFSLLENAGYYILYSIRPDNKYENLSDVSYPRVSYYDINSIALLQSAFKNPYFTAFLNKYYRWVSGKLQTKVWTGRARAPLIYYLLWYDPDQKEADLNELPLSRKFGDVIIMRTGFDEDDTFISFKSGTHWGFHSQLDHGSFTIYKYAPLAIDSGFYDSLRHGREHVWDYWKRSIAHNVVLVYDRKETWPEHPRGNLNRNDGGQRMVFRAYSPPARGKGATHNPVSYEYIKNEWDNFKMGEITAYEFSGPYDYIKTDLTNAYTNTYSGRGNNQPKKVDFVQREFVFLRPDFIIVYDRIDAARPYFKKKWLLHSGNYYDKSGKPSLEGPYQVIQGAEDAGIVESNTADSYTIVEGNGKLFVHTLLPEKSLVRRIGGAGYEFWVDGENVSLSSSRISKERQDENPGAWRIEVEPISNNIYDEFLHVLYAASIDVAKAPVSELIVHNDALDGIYVKNGGQEWVVVFQKKNPADRKITYSVQMQNGCRQVIFGMSPAKKYRIDRRKNTFTIYESEDGTYVSTDNGVLTFISGEIKE
ncbi:MAG: hypothetical protein JXD21_05980 [Candidatus Omnitrophica bacterium]|nr:hypothetical protein [Candidatus Omnitrophota bacterium]